MAAILTSVKRTKKLRYLLFWVHDQIWITTLQYILIWNLYVVNIIWYTKYIKSYNHQKHLVQNLSMAESFTRTEASQMKMVHTCVLPTQRFPAIPLTETRLLSNFPKDVQGLRVMTSWSVRNQICSRLANSARQFPQPASHRHLSDICQKAPGMWQYVSGIRPPRINPEFTVHTPQWRNLLYDFFVTE